SFSSVRAPGAGGCTIWRSSSMLLTTFSNELISPPWNQNLTIVTPGRLVTLPLGRRERDRVRRCSMARIDEIAPDLFRVSIYVPQFDLQFTCAVANTSRTVSNVWVTRRRSRREPTAPRRDLRCTAATLRRTAWGLTEVIP